MKGRERLTVAKGSGKVRRRCGQGWSSATDMVASGEGGPDDVARERMAKAMVSTACLHSCCSEDEGWLEREAVSGDDGEVAALQKSDNSKL
jgi:hypothetical protein